MPSPERMATKQGADFVSDPYKYLEFYNDLKKIIIAYEEIFCCLYGYNDDCHNGM